MRARLPFLLTALVLALAGAQPPQARNPVLAGADPHAAVFEGRVWLFPTGTRGSDPRFFVYSSRDLQSWTDHGPVLDFADIPWIKEDGQPTHFAWAPAIAERGGKFYFYFSVGPQGRTPSRIGVAVGDSPAGPFKDSGRPLLTGGNGFEAIDPMVFKDPETGRFFFYAGGSAGATLRTFELNPDMVSFKAEIPTQTPHRFTEGPFVHYRKGLYYMSYSHGSWRHSSYSSHYAVGISPTGPWHYRGELLTSGPRHKGPGHHSIFNLGDDWYIAYHRWNDREGDGPYSGPREVAIDRLKHLPDRSIAPVEMTDVVPTPAGDANQRVSRASGPPSSPRRR
jgi:beta-xylosidase